jgi:hypothetical protein
MRRLIHFALLGMIATACFAADVTGKWTAQVPGRGGNTQENTFTLKQEGAKLSGTLAGGRGGDVQITDGKVEGDTVTFTVVRMFNDMTIKQIFKGTVAGSEIKFSRTMEGGQGGGQPVEFVAKKAS